MAKLEDFQLTEATVIKTVWLCLSINIQGNGQNSEFRNTLTHIWLFDFLLKCYGNSMSKSIYPQKNLAGTTAYLHEK